MTAAGRGRRRLQWLVDRSKIAFSSGEVVHFGGRVAIGIVLMILGHTAASSLQRAVQNKHLSIGTQGVSPEHPPSAPGRLDPTAVLLGTVVYWLVMALVLALILGLLGVQVASVMAAVATVAVLLGFALQGVLNDFTSGIIIALTRVFYIGEVIEVDGVLGTVASFNIINTTVLDAATRTRVTVPNRRLQDSIVINHSRQPRRYVVVDVLVSNSNRDFNAIAELMQQAVVGGAAVLPLAKGAAPPTAGVKDMSEVGTKMRVSFAIDAQDYQPAKLAAMNLRVRQALADKGVKLVDPF
jgi:small conductance mechanosensitive channel